MSDKKHLTMGIPVCIENMQLKQLTKFFHLNEQQHNEFLQNTLFSNPELIPIDELSPDYGALIPLGKDIKSDAGNIDCMFINTQGNITIVETKVRGKDTPHIIDFKNEVQSWNFDNLERLAQRFHQKGLLDLLKSKENISDEEAGEIFINITNNLKNAKFLLLIVSDRMNTYVEKLYTTYQTMRTTSHLGLVKLNLFKYADEDKFVIIPSTLINFATQSPSAKVVLQKSEEIEIRDFSSDEEKFFSKLEERVTPDMVKFAKQIATDTEKIGCIIEWKPTSLIIKFPNHKNPKKLITLFMIQIYGEVVQGDIEDQFEKYHYSESIAKNFINSLIFNIGFKKGSVNLEFLKPNYKKFLDLIQDTLSQVKS